MLDGDLPTYTFDFAPGVSAPRGQAVRCARITAGDAGEPQRFRYRFNDVLLTRATGARLSAPLADALDIAFAVYVADRYAPRPRAGLRAWYRHLVVCIPVRQPRLWGSQEHQAALERFLTHLTDDRWSIAFTAREAGPRRAECEEPLFSATDGAAPVTVLHSGGLDSCIGIIEAAQMHSGGSVLAVSMVSHSHPSCVQGRVLSSLRPHLPAEVTWARLFTGLSGVARADQESSQRGRGFFYLTAGAVAAALSGSPRLQVCENGLGAINLPCSPDQLGATNTRAMHPVTLARFSTLISALTAQPLSVWNTGLWQTKGELCRAFLTSKELTAAAQQTVSCDRFPWTGLGRTCGSCTSCLVRRASLHAAGLSSVNGADGPRADFDPLSPETTWADHDLLPIYALQAQAARLERAARTPVSFVEDFPQLTRLWQAAAHLGITSAVIEERVLRLLLAYTREWGAFAADVAWPASSEAPAVANIDSSVAAIAS